MKCGETTCSRIFFYFIRISWFQLTINGELIKEQTDNYRDWRRAKQIQSAAGHQQTSVNHIFMSSWQHFVAVVVVVLFLLLFLFFFLSTNLQYTNYEQNTINFNMHLLIPCNQYGKGIYRVLNLVQTSDIRNTYIV